MLKDLGQRTFTPPFGSEPITIRAWYADPVPELPTLRAIYEGDDVGEKTGDGYIAPPGPVPFPQDVEAMDAASPETFVFDDSQAAGGMLLVNLGGPTVGWFVKPVGGDKGGEDDGEEK